MELELRKFRRWPLRCPVRWPLSEVSPLKYRGVAKSEDAKMAKSEDAPTREVTAAAKGGEVATCKNLEKNDLFMSRLESKMQK